MCKEDGQITAASVVDHIEPITKAPERRLDPTNLQSLCKTHHDSTKQAEEHGTIRGCDAAGLPTDLTHGWNA